MKKLLLTNGQPTILDDTDYELYKNSRPFIANGGYATILVKENGKNRNRMISRLILKAKKGEIVDHINHDKLDNRRENLRICTPLQSAWNRRGHKDSKSGFAGVSYHTKNSLTKPWRARIFYKREIYLGCYETKEEAAKAYNKAAKDYFGEFACLNKIYA